MEKSPRWRGRARRLLSGEASGYPWPRSASLHLERSSEERTEPSKRELLLPDAASAEFPPAATLIFQLVPTVAESAKAHVSNSKLRAPKQSLCPAKNRPVLFAPIYPPGRLPMIILSEATNRLVCVQAQKCPSKGKKGTARSLAGTVEKRATSMAKLVLNVVMVILAVP